MLACIIAACARTNRRLEFILLDQWPDDALGPDATLLRGARKVQRSLAAACERCYHIIGVEQETVVRIAKQRNGFVYHYAHDGDGTVPRALAEWPGAQTWYVAERHGNLPNNQQVCQAIVDILKRGTTRRLQRNWMPSKSPAHNVSDAQLRRELRGKVALDRLPMKRADACSILHLSGIYRAGRDHAQSVR